MLDDMASLRQAMEQMDAQDPAVAQAAKDRAAQILKDAKLSFSKMADMIEERRLLLRPRILAGIKRMDHEMLGDIEFRNTSSALRKEGQSFRQIAEAIDLNREAAARHEDPVPKGELSHEMDSDPDGLERARAANGVARIVSYPRRHPFQLLTIALTAGGLVYAFSGGTDHKPIDGASPAATSPTPACPTPSTSAAASSTPCPTPSATRASASATNAAGSAPSAKVSPSSTPSPTASTCPPNAAKCRDANGPCPSGWNDCQQTTTRRLFGSIIPCELRRNSSCAGPCIGGVGGCNWAGGQF